MSNATTENRSAFCYSTSDGKPLVFARKDHCQRLSDFKPLSDDICKTEAQISVTTDPSTNRRRFAASWTAASGKDKGITQRREIKHDGYDDVERVGTVGESGSRTQRGRLYLVGPETVDSANHEQLASLGIDANTVQTWKAQGYKVCSADHALYEKQLDLFSLGSESGDDWELTGSRNEVEDKVGPIVDEGWELMQ